MFQSTAHLLQTLNDLRLHVLITMIVLGPELPVSEQRVADYVGCNRDTARSHLRKLQILNLTQQLPGRKNGWTLTSEVQQLPLPLLWRGYTENLAAGTQPPLTTIVESTQSQPSELRKSSANMAESTQSQRPELRKSSANVAESTQSQRPELRKSSANNVESAQSQRPELRKSSANHVESTQSQPSELRKSSANREKLRKTSAETAELRKSSAVFAPINKHAVVVGDQLIDEQQQQHVTADLRKSSAHAPPTAVFLAAIGLDEPIPSDFAGFPLEAVLGYWFYCLAKKFVNPQGYIRRRLEQDHQKPVADYLKLAAAWLQLDDEQRLTVREELEGLISRSQHICLPEDFPWLPYTPLLNAWHGARETGTPFLPLALFPDFAEEAENDEGGDGGA